MHNVTLLLFKVRVRVTISVSRNIKPKLTASLLLITATRTICNSSLRTCCIFAYQYCLRLLFAFCVLLLLSSAHIHWLWASLTSPCAYRLNFVVVVTCFYYLWPWLWAMWLNIDLCWGEVVRSFDVCGLEYGEAVTELLRQGKCIGLM